MQFQTNDIVSNGCANAEVRDVCTGSSAGKPYHFQARGESLVDQTKTTICSYRDL